MEDLSSIRLSRLLAHSADRGERYCRSYRSAQRGTGVLITLERSHSSRFRKSKCDGDKPCKACVVRGKPDECFYTVSRRGGKPKKKHPEAEQQVQNHLKSLLSMTNLPHTIRIPGAVSHLQPFQQEAVAGAAQQQQQPAGAGNLGMTNILEALQQGQVQAGGQMLVPPSYLMNGAGDPSASGQGVASGSSSSGPDYAQLNSAAAAAAASFFNAQQQQQQAQGGSYPPSMMPTSPSTIAASPQQAQASSETFASPRATTSTLQPPPHAHAGLSEPSARRSLLIDYYRYIYRFIPVLLPPEHLETLVQSFGPNSPFLLALQCILPLLRDEEQPPGPIHGLNGSGLNFGSPEKKKRVRETTSYYQRQTSEAIENALEKADEAEGPAAILEVIQALCVLIIYEVCRPNRNLSCSLIWLTFLPFPHIVRQRKGTESQVESRSGAGTRDVQGPASALGAKHI